MPRDEDTLPLPSLVGFHATAARRAKRLPQGSWRTLMGLPALCDALGRTTPRWVLDLLDHAGDLATELPAAVLGPLTSPLTIAVAKCESPAARRWGETMGLWVPSVLPEPASRFLLEQGYSTADDIAASMVLTPLGHLVRILRGVERPPRVGREQLLEPYRPFVPGEAPEVVEDGTKGVVSFKLENPDEGSGSARLTRGDRYERLFRGRWVSVDQAEQYAREHGHEFEGDG